MRRTATYKEAAKYGYDRFHAIEPFFHSLKVVLAVLF